MKLSKLHFPLLKFLLMTFAGNKENKRGVKTADKICLVIKQNFFCTISNCQYLQLFVINYNPLIQILPVASFITIPLTITKSNTIFPGG